MLGSFSLETLRACAAEDDGEMQPDLGVFHQNYDLPIYAHTDKAGTPHGKSCRRVENAIVYPRKALDDEIIVPFPFEHGLLKLTSPDELVRGDGTSMKGDGYLRQRLLHQTVYHMGKGIKDDYGR